MDALLIRILIIVRRAGSFEHRQKLPYFIRCPLRHFPVSVDGTLGFVVHLRVILIDLARQFLDLRKRPLHLLVKHLHNLINGPHPEIVVGLAQVSKIELQLALALLIGLELLSCSIAL